MEDPKYSLSRKYPCKACNGGKDYPENCIPHRTLNTNTTGGLTYTHDYVCKECRGTGIDLIQAVLGLEERLSIIENRAANGH